MAERTPCADPLSPDRWHHERSHPCDFIHNACLASEAQEKSLSPDRWHHARSHPCDFLHNACRACGPTPSEAPIRGTGKKFKSASPRGSCKKKSIVFPLHGLWPLFVPLHGLSPLDHCSNTMGTKENDVIPAPHTHAIYTPLYSPLFSQLF